MVGKELVTKFNDINKTFKNDIEVIFNLLKNKYKFAFSKYADGEFAILTNKKITNCDNWTFNPDEHNLYHKELLNSFKYNEIGYYVGISCPCCVGNKDTKWMRDNVGVSNDYLTWANIFVNSNYEFFKRNFLPEFNNHNVILIANKNANINNLPFKVEEFIPITNTAWIDNFNLINELSLVDYKDKLFLFCAGPLGNMLSAKLWSVNKNNIYLDIGSTLNPYLVGNNRGYHKGKNTNKVCIW